MGVERRGGGGGGVPAENSQSPCFPGEPRQHLCIGVSVCAPHPPSVHKLRVALGPCDDDVHPDAHGLGRGGHHVVEPVVGLHTECQRGVGALETHTHTHLE